MQYIMRKCKLCGRDLISRDDTVEVLLDDEIHPAHEVCGFEIQRRIHDGCCYFCNAIIAESVMPEKHCTDKVFKGY